MKLTTKADSPSSNIIEAGINAFSYNFMISKILTETNNLKIHLKVALLILCFILLVFQKVKSLISLREEA